MPQLPGLVKGLGVTFKTMLAGAVTVQYPHVKEAPPPPAASSPSRRRTAPSACSAPASAPTGASTSRATRRSGRPPARGGKPRTVSVLDRFDIDYALCMYCGICVEVCPFDALFWSPSTSTPSPASPTSSTTRRSSASGCRRCPSPSRSRSAPRSRVRSSACHSRRGRSPERRLRDHRRRHGGRRHRRRDDEEHRARRPGPGRRAGRGGGPVRPPPGRVPRHRADRHLHRRHRRAVPVRHHADPGADRTRRRPRQRPAGPGRPGVAAVLLGVLGSCCSTSSAMDKLHLGPARSDRAPPTSPTRSSAPTWSPSRSSPCCCWPRSSAPSSWPGETDPVPITDSTCSCRPSSSAPASTACWPAATASSC